MATKSLTDCNFELGPIRPPSEAFSLLIRVTRNCPWNRCRFCSVYKGKKFELRPAEDVIEDIKMAKAIRDGIKELAWKTGHGDNLREAAATVYHQYSHIDAIRNVAMWMYAGGKSAFLQDANSLIMRTPDLVRVVAFLKETFPELERITSYARSKTAAKKTVEELKQLREAGLSRLHIGMESGSDKVLEYIDKGVTGDEHVKGGLNVKAAGMELSEYIMPGLGGRKLTVDHYEGTADVLNRIDPHFIRVRTLYMTPRQLMWEDIQNGEFEPLTEDEVVREIGNLIERLELTSYFVSDHMMNLLPELEGKFPEAKQHLLDVVARYFALSPEQRLNYRLGRRAGYYERLSDLKDMNRYQKVEGMLDQIREQSEETIDQIIDRIKQGFL
jgi:hypothetical protein